VSGREFKKEDAAKRPRGAFIPSSSSPPAQGTNGFGQGLKRDNEPQTVPSAGRAECRDRASQISSGKLGARTAPHLPVKFGAPRTLGERDGGSDSVSEVLATGMNFACPPPDAGNKLTHFIKLGVCPPQRRSAEQKDTFFPQGERLEVRGDALLARHGHFKTFNQPRRPAHRSSRDAQVMAARPGLFARRRPPRRFHLPASH